MQVGTQQVCTFSNCFAGLCVPTFSTIFFTTTSSSSQITLAASRIIFMSGGSFLAIPPSYLASQLCVKFGVSQSPGLAQLQPNYATTSLGDAYQRQRLMPSSSCTAPFAQVVYQEFFSRLNSDLLKGSQCVIQCLFSAIMGPTIMESHTGSDNSFLTNGIWTKLQGKHLIYKFFYIEIIMISLVVSRRHRACISAVHPENSTLESETNIFQDLGNHVNYLMLGKSSCCSTLFYEYCIHYGPANSRELSFIV